MKPLITGLSVSVTSNTFPGLLGRGLIEAEFSATTVTMMLVPSPVYWAGASLKRA